MKKLLLFVSIFSLAGAAHAQQDPQFSQNYFNRVFPNPAAAGATDNICATMLGRHQWVGFDGRPETYMFNASMPFTDPWLGQNHGVGLSVLSDQLGQESTFGVKLAYSYKMPFSLGPGQLSAGFAVGLINKSIGNDWDAIDDIDQDPSIPIAGTSDMAFDMDFGVYYRIPNKLYFGISATHLNAPQLEEGDIAPNDPISGAVSTMQYGNARHFYVMGGYEHAINSDFVLKPNFFLRTDAVSASFDIGALVEYQEMIWGGLSYRLQDAIVPTAGFKYSFAGKGIKGGTLRFGYSYDVTTSLLRQHSSGSHELMLGYCFGINPKIKPTRSRSVRFL